MVKSNLPVCIDAVGDTLISVVTGSTIAKWMTEKRDSNLPLNLSGMATLSHKCILRQYRAALLLRAGCALPVWVLFHRARNTNFRLTGDSNQAKRARLFTPQ